MTNLPPAFTPTQFSTTAEPLMVTVPVLVSKMDQMPEEAFATATAVPVRSLLLIPKIGAKDNWQMSLSHHHLDGWRWGRSFCRFGGEPLVLDVTPIAFIHLTIG